MRSARAGRDATPLLLTPYSPGAHLTRARALARAVDDDRSFVPHAIVLLSSAGDTPGPRDRAPLLRYRATTLGPRVIIQGPSRVAPMLHHEEEN